MAQTTLPPFQHEARCKYKDVEPEWVPDYNAGCERRQCVCTSMSRPLPVKGQTGSPEPSVAAHLHSPPGCPGAGSDLAVSMKPDPHAPAGWVSQCGMCTSITHYWHDPNRWEQNPDGDMVRVTRLGNTLLVYERKTL